MNFEKNLGQERAEQGSNFDFSVEKKNEGRIFHIGEKEYREGEKVTVLRSSGEVEQDWELKSVGDKFVVVEKIDVSDGALLRKVVPGDEFIKWQDSEEKTEKTYAGLEEGYGRSGGNRRIDVGKAEIAVSKELAERLGIDTSKSDWQVNLNKKIREIVDA